MESEATAPVNPARWPGIVLAAGAFLICYFVARYGMWAWAPEQPWDIVVMSAPLLALAFLTVMLALMGLGLIEETPRGRVTLPLRDLWFALIPLYGICYVAASRHYR
jgi:hypothetical protein